MAGRITVEKQGALGFLIFDHPERRNAISVEMWKEIPQAAAELERDSDVRVVILRGVGEVAFVAGADISEFERTRSGGNAEDYDRDNVRAFAALTNIAKPVLAMIHGFCVGGGMAIALTADMRYAADDVQMGIPAAKLGLGYGMAGIDVLSRLVGSSRAMEIFFTAKRFGPEAALRMGLLNDVFPKDRLESEVIAIAETIAKNAPLTVGAVKLTVRQLHRQPADRDVDAVKRAIAACYASEDYKEGVSAFLQKRSPAFKGR
jgi:enoyl-CoA hydratase/carnithine racemase